MLQACLGVAIASQLSVCATDRRQQRDTPEAELLRQLAAAKADADKSRERADKALAAKRRYKEQVCKGA